MTRISFIQSNIIYKKFVTIYFAGPLFSKAEQAFNLELAELLEAKGFEVFLPQRDGVESSKPPYNKMSKAKRRKVMFELDRDKIQACDIFLMILDGRVPDEGASVELGMAYVFKQLQQPEKQLIGLHTDSRAAFMGSKLNPMLKVPLDYIAEDEKDLLQLLEKH